MADLRDDLTKAFDEACCTCKLNAIMPPRNGIGCCVHPRSERAWADSNTECPYFLIQRQVFMIPAGTKVKVSDRGGTIKEHVLKYAMVFEPKDRRYGEHTDVSFQFVTGHPNWIYMYVPKYTDDGKLVRTCPT